MNRIEHKPQTRSILPEAALNKHQPAPGKRRDRSAKQLALIRAALRLFASKGYEATTTREIAAAAGCAEGLIHRYFKGKAGLLPALAEFRISQEVLDLSHRLRPAASFEEEFLQLVAWEVDFAWQTRDFYRVFIPRAMVDPSVASVMRRVVLSARTQAIMERLQRYRSCSTLPPGDLDVLVQSVGMLGLVFGFMRPMVLGQDRELAKEMATTFAKLLVRGIHLQRR